MKLGSAVLNLFRLRRDRRELPLVAAARPARADIEPTTRCNFRCPHCPTTGDVPGFVRRHMSLSEFTSLLDQLPTVYRIKLVGLGEPLLNPDFFDMVREAGRRRVRVLTTTNGSLLDAERRRELLACGLNHLNVSVDAARPETHARLRPGSDLEQIGVDLASLVEERGPRRRPVIRVWHVIQRESVPELPDLVTRCAEWGVDALLCTAKLTNFGLSSLEDVVAERRAVAEDLRRVLPEARRRAEALGLEFRCPDAPPPPRRPEEGRPCRWPWSRTFISVTGEVFPCPYARGPDGSALGRVLPAAEGEEGDGTSSFASVWNGAAMQDLRARLRDRRNPAFCRACYPGWTPD